MRETTPRLHLKLAQQSVKRSTYDFFHLSNEVESLSSGQTDSSRQSHAAREHTGVHLQLFWFLQECMAIVGKQAKLALGEKVGNIVNARCLTTLLSSPLFFLHFYLDGGEDSILLILRKLKTRRTTTTRH